MENSIKLPDKFMEVIKHEGVVAVVSWGEGEPHVVNTWNSFIVVTEDQRILILVYGFRKTEKNVNVNNRIKITLGTREVTGYKDYPGTGFLINGTARFLNSGPEFDLMKEKFSFPNRVMEVTVASAKQTI
ncbi:MAG: pyridoxamine 5'-phosphate oxidase family protein [Tannerellaceae bacterium]|nr:pyridoxamine 5'-phosphate oxidase family protein [Tannerellaceae bacterium]